MLNHLFFLYNNLIIVYISYKISRIFIKDKYRCFVVFCNLIPISILFLLLSLGVIGYLTQKGVFVVSTCIAILITFTAPKSQNFVSEIRLSQKCSPSLNIISHLIFGLLSATFLIFLIETCFFGTFFCSDDFSYHATVVIHWLKDQKITLMPQNYHAFYPFNAELFSLWFVLPIKNDSLVCFSGFFWGFLLVVNSMTILKTIGLHRDKIFLLAIILLSSKIIFSVQTFTGVDLAAPAITLATIALLMDLHKNRNMRVCLAFSGLFLGFAIGAKISYAPVYICCLLWVVINKKIAFKEKCVNMLIFTFFVFLTGAFWYVRNMILTGNPVYPAEFLFFDGPLRSQRLSRTKLIYWILKDPFNLSQWRSIIKGYLDWPHIFGVLSCFGYIFTILILFKNKIFKRINSIPNYGLLLLIGVVFTIFFPLTPFSGTANAPTACLRHNIRYVILPFTIGILLFSSLMKYIKKHNDILLCSMLIIIVLGYNDGVYRSFVLKLIFLIAGIISMLAHKLWFSKIKKINLLKVTMIFLTMLFLTLTLWESLNKKITTHRLIVYGSSAGKPVGKAWHAINSLPDDSNISYYGSEAYQYYCLFGRRFQMNPIYLNADGSKQGPMDSYIEKDLIMGNFLKNILDNNIDYVFTTKWQNNLWPQQHFILKNSKEAKDIYNDGYSALWKIDH